jgi:hypothetical protein
METSNGALFPITGLFTTVLAALGQSGDPDGPGGLPQRIARMVLTSLPQPLVNSEWPVQMLGTTECC